MILIFESSLDGHRVRYVNYLIETLLEVGSSIAVILPTGSERSVEYQSVLARHAARVDFCFTIPPHPGGGWRNAWVRWRALYTQIVLLRPERVVLPTADVLAQACGLFRFFYWRKAIRKVEIYATLLRLRIIPRTHSFRSLLKTNINVFLLLLAPFRQIASIDEFAVEAVPVSLRKALRLRYVAEPIEIPVSKNKYVARQRLNLPQEKQLVGCVGVLDSRKGIRELLAAIESSDWPPHAILVLAGPVSQEWRIKIDQMVERFPDRLLFAPGWLSEEQLLDYLTSFDLACVLYFDHFDPSSIIVKAVACGTPLLASDQGWIGRFVAVHGVGHAIAASHGDGVARHVNFALRGLAGQKGRCSQAPLWLHTYDPAVFAKKISGLT